jgi:predicted RNase H-like HicB family nuclease
MIQDFINRYIAMARYEMIDDGARFYAEIKQLQGVWAIGDTLEECRENLLSTLEGWLILRLRKNLPIPTFKPRITKLQMKAYAKT